MRQSFAPALGCLMLVACGSSAPGFSDLGDGVLAPLTALSPLEAEDDPLAAHRPDQVVCSSLTGWYPEEGALEVSTANCNYLALTEPAAISANADQTVTTQITHFDLTAEEPAEAHLALLIRGQIVWESTIMIPSAGQVIDVSFELSESVREGDPIGVHLHNHGQNSWNFSPWLVSP